MRYSPSIHTGPCRLAFLAFILLVALAACSARPAGMDRAGAGSDPVMADAPSVNAIDELQGRWRSRSDTSVSIEIQGHRFLSRYNETIVGHGVVTFVNDCEERLHDPQGEFFIVSDEADALCYHLTQVSDTLLEYVYLPRGTTLSYERIE